MRTRAPRPQGPRTATASRTWLGPAAPAKGGFAEYYWHRGPPAVRELDRMMDRVAAEAERMAALVDTLAGASDGQGQDQRPCPPRSPSRLLKAQAQAGSQWG